jgi:hypothetical protein
MAEFRYLVHFENDTGDRFFANGDTPDPVIGEKVAAYQSFDDLMERKDAVNTAIAKVLKTASVLTAYLCRDLYSQQYAASSPFACSRVTDLLCGTQL